jgi:MFS transporter, DHA1 family, multidrug resistance protein
VTVAYLVLFIAFVDNFAMLPTVAPYATAMGAGLTGVGVAVGAYSATNLAFNVVGGILLDRVGRRRLLIASLLLVSAAMLLYPLAASLGALVGVRLLHGAAGGILVPAVFTVLGDRAPVGGRGRAMGRAGAVIGAAAVLAPAMAGVIRQTAGFSAVFWTVAAIAAVGAIVAAVWLEETRPTVRRQGGARIASLLRRRGLRLAYGTAFAFTGAVGSLAAFLPRHATGLGLAAGATGGLFTLFALVAAGVMLSRVAGLAEVQGLAAPISLGLGAYAVALGLLAMVPGLGLTVLAVGLFGVGYGLVFPAMAGAVGAEAEPAERGRAYGLFLAFFSLGFVVMPPAGGAVGDAWPAVGPFAAAAAVCLLGALVALLHGRQPTHA